MRWLPGPGLRRGAALLDAVLKGGAACLDQPMGAIAVGKRCDIAVLDDGHPAMIGRAGDAALDTWIFSAGNAAVKDVIVGGLACGEGSPAYRRRPHSKEIC